MPAVPPLSHARSLPHHPPQQASLTNRPTTAKPCTRSLLEPYLAALTTSGGQTVEALLLKYARGSQTTPDAPMIFSAR